MEKKTFVSIPIEHSHRLYLRAFHCLSLDHHWRLGLPPRLPGNKPTVEPLPPLFPAGLEQTGQVGGGPSMQRIARSKLVFCFGLKEQCFQYAPDYNSVSLEFRRILIVCSADVRLFHREPMLRVPALNESLALSATAFFAPLCVAWLIL